MRALQLKCIWDPLATGGYHTDASAAMKHCGINGNVATSPVWPPASVPWAQIISIPTCKHSDMHGAWIYTTHLLKPKNICQWLVQWCHLSCAGDIAKVTSHLLFHGITVPVQYARVHSSGCAIWGKSTVTYEDPDIPWHRCAPQGLWPHGVVRQPCS